MQAGYILHVFTIALSKPLLGFFFLNADTYSERDVKESEEK